MNQRIRELAEQCWEERKYGPAWFNQKKFAELLIRECTNMLPNDSIRNEEGVHMFYVIREHFGVPVIGR